MRKFGFNSKFISWISMFYRNAISSCIVNGFITKPFDIERGVRQGCPLSMLLFIIFQEPLYRAIERSDNIIALSLPCGTRKLLGFADDTSVIVSTENSITSCFEIINSFELATGLSLNKRKTKLFGVGQWRDESEWPMSNINVLKEEICILGIVFMNDFDRAVSASWSRVVQKINKQVLIFNARNVSIFQRAIIVNILVLSKVWYISHTYPLSKKQAQAINKIIFCYIWNSVVEPLKRQIIYREKENGGINLLNVYTKALSNYVNSFIISFLNNSENNTMLKYYCACRLNPLFNIRELPQNVSFVSPQYYNICIDVIRKCKQIQGFPNLSSRIIYKYLTGVENTCTALVEEKYSIFNWKDIWKNISFTLISPYDHSIIFKYIHEIIPNRHRLFIIKKYFHQIVIIVIWKRTTCIWSINVVKL